MSGSEGGNGAADSGLAALFDAAGSLTATTELTVKNASTAAHAYLADDGTIGFHAAGETNPRELVFPTDVLENEAKEIATKNWVAANTTAAAKRVITTTDDATAVIDVTATDVYQLSAVDNATTVTLSGTAVDGQQILVRIKDAGVAKALTWTGFTAIGVTLPTTTTASKWTYVGCTYNAAATAWHVIAVTTES